MHSKYNPHKSCGCAWCKAGRGSRWAQAELRRADRKERHLTRLKLKQDPHNFEPVLVRTSYTD